MQAVKTGAHGFKKFYDGVQYVLEIEPVLTIRRIIWIVLGGWVVAGLFLFAGLVLCLTIVGIPMGLEAFRWAIWAILPIGFKPVPIPPEEATSDLHRPGTTYNTAANVIWLVCFGWLIILSLVMAFISNIITIIGIFTAVQFARLSKFSVWPYGMKIVSKKSLKRKRKEERERERAQRVEMGVAGLSAAQTTTQAQAY
ncbi:uncharacterized protein ACA1_236680 [Acanthamoeba castellanii str. Neff]|uniref:Membrane protein, putative n=1 Tax=Acanthamoeba castellanii (strain ATCC 30010 / Neff) TaxID=1257118 RepID=L8H1H4_ACACF|nr:uncharacterized protein ACA1_236680 [Acanthamoeba castellanii str. Neff]ELR19080.1 membrane protein, putative [Acanthamoeba castellanii str. Neff]